MSILDYNYNGHTLTFDDRLIDLVRAHPAIYDVNNINYRRNSARQEIWHKISRMLGASSKTCQVKWKNIRYNYLQEIKSPRNPNIRRRRLTRDLSFLKNTALGYKKGDKSSQDGNYIYKPDNQDDFYEIVMVEPSEDESCAGTSSSTYMRDDEIDIKPIVVGETDITKVTASDEPTQSQNVNVSEVATSSVSDLNTNNSRRDEDWSQIPRREQDRTHDAIEMYCLSLADSLRAMSRSERERVKFEFANILKDAQYQDSS